MKSALYIDSFVLACPSDQSDDETFIEYINNLLSLDEIKNDELVDIYISQNASNALAELSVFPAHSVIKNVIVKLGITHIQSNDVNRLVETILTKSKYIEKELGIEDVLFESCLFNPNVFNRIKPQIFVNHLNYLSVMLSLHSFLSPSYSNQILATFNDINFEQKIAFSANILTFIKSELINNEIIIQEPLTINSNFFVGISSNSIYNFIDPCILWANSINDIEYKKAIKLFSYHKSNHETTYTNFIENFKYKFGTHFISSCKEHGFTHDTTKISMLLRTIYEIIYESNLSDTHFIRTSKSGNAPQLKRGNDGAWRRDIDRFYHLHYWKTDTGPELACVVVHDDFTIPE